MNSKINGLSIKKYFFEEAYAKEFIERNGLRNAPVIEMDDREKFYFISRQKECYSFGLTGYKVNNQCLKKFNNKLKKINIYKVENKSFIQNPITAQISYNAIVKKNELTLLNEIVNGSYDNSDVNINLYKNVKELKKNYKKIKILKIIKLFQKIHNIYGSHALKNYNNKFLFDPIFNELIPVNWDTNVILSDKCIRSHGNYIENIKTNNSLKKKK